jgi:hypothetical protein
MKKTIAILLILVIGMVGVFAEGNDPPTPATLESSKTLKLTTTVQQLTGFKVTQEAIDVNDIHDYSKFAGLYERGSVAVNTAGTMTDKAYLTVANNSTTPFSIGVKGSELSATGISTKIQYTYAVGSVTNGTSLATDAVEGAVFTKALSVTGSTTHGMQITSQEITVKVNQNDFDSAAPGNYTALLYFNIATE